jgi:hypothetical protein
LEGDVDGCGWMRMYANVDMEMDVDIDGDRDGDMGMRMESEKELFHNFLVLFIPAVCHKSYGERERAHEQLLVLFIPVVCPKTYIYSVSATAT